MTMRTLMTLLTVALAGSGATCLSLACKTPEKDAMMLKMLQEGKARGHLTMGSQAILGVTQRTEVGIGALGTTVTFDGDINFADAEFDEFIEAARRAGVTMPGDDDDAVGTVATP